MPQDALTVLGRLFLPAFVLHVAQKLWWWLTVPHAPLPLTLGHTHVVEALFFLLTSYSWTFRTICFLYVCVLFWGICGLQVSGIFENGRNQRRRLRTGSASLSNGEASVGRLNSCGARFWLCT